MNAKKRKVSIKAGAVMGLSAFFLLYQPHPVLPQAQFYQGKTITVIAGQEPDPAAVTLSVMAKDVRLMTERWLAGDKKAGSELTATLREHPQTGLETAAEYGNAGLWQDGTAVLTKLIDAAKDKSRVSPLAYYYLGQFAEQSGNTAHAEQHCGFAVAMSPEYCFPFQWEAIDALRRAAALTLSDIDHM